MNLVEKLAAEKKAALAITGKGLENITDEEQKELKAHYEEAKRLSERLELFKSVNTDLDRLGAQPKAAPQVRARTLGELYAAELQEKGLSVVETKSHPFSTSEFKAAADTHVAGGADGAYGPAVTDIDLTGAWPYERALTVADLFSSGSVTGNSIKYPVYGSFEGTPSAVAEAGQKPQLHLADPTWIVDALSEIAAYWKVSDDMADDLPYIVSEINQHAQYNLLLQEELQLLSGDGTDASLKGILNRTGVQTLAKGTDADPDRIFKATTLISTATGFPADAVVINPSDYETLRLSKDSNGQYFGGGFFSGQYGNGGVLQNPALWGLRTVVTPSVTAGTVLVGAFKAGGMVFRKGGLRAESTNSNENDFTNDKITFRVKERLGLQVKYPSAFVSVTLGTASTSSDKASTSSDK